MIYLQNLLGFSGVYDRASAFCLFLLAISGVICAIIYFVLIRDRYEARLQKQIRKEQREERRAKRLAEKITR